MTGGLSDVLPGLYVSPPESSQFIKQTLSESDEQVLAVKCSFENKTGPNSPELDPHVILTSEPQSPHL